MCIFSIFIIGQFSLISFVTVIFGGLIFAHLHSWLFCSPLFLPTVPWAVFFFSSVGFWLSGGDWGLTS